MAVNDLTFNQLSTLLNGIMEQATGQSSLAPTNTNEFVSVGQTLLKMGYDPLNTAISQVLSRTIFSIRPYSAKFSGMRVTNQRFGNWMRKLNIVDKDFSEDVRFDLTDGESIDMYKVNKPSILQTNFYGSNIFEKNYTIFKDQLDCAFSSPEEFARFVTMVTQNASDLIEQAHENLARATLANFIAGKVEGDPDSVIHLLSEYNALTGLSLTSSSVYLPANYRSFMQWVFARIASISSLMTERTTKFQINVTNKPISRHTPVSMQRVYLYAPARFQTETMAIADTYHDNFLRFADNETVNFWQSIDTPDTINISPVYLLPSGQLETASAPVSLSDIFGVIMDEEACGYTVVNQWSAPTPFNAKGGYTNYFFHFTDRYLNDFTEKGVVLLLN